MRLLLILLIAMPSVHLVGCGEDTTTVSRTRRGTGSKRSRNKPKAVNKGSKPVEHYHRTLVSASWEERETLVAEAKASTLRDPFEVAAENLVEEEQEVETTNDPKLESVVSGYEVSELKFMAVTGQPPAFALLKDPSGFGHDVYVGDIVGTKPRMRVEAITNNEIVFQAVERVKGSDVEIREHRKSLLTQEELQELQP